MAEISMEELRKRNEELSKNYTYDNNTSMGENNIPVTDSTVGRTVELPDFEVKGRKSSRTAMRGKLPLRQTSGSYRETSSKRKDVSNLITNNPFVPKKEFKMPKLKFSGKGKRTAMRGKIK